jgi:hypothetical protein
MDSQGWSQPWTQDEPRLLLVVRRWNQGEGHGTISLNWKQSNATWVAWEEVASGEVNPGAKGQ